MIQPTSTIHLTADSTVNDAMNVLGENLFTDILLVLVALITNFNFHDSGQASIQAGN